MPTITFTTQSAAGDIVNTISTPLKAKLAQLGGNRRMITFPYGPQGVTYDDIGLEYATKDRPGLRSLLIPSGKKRRTINVTAVIANPDSYGQTSVEDMLHEFRAIANETADVAFTYGVVSLPFRFRMTELSIVAIKRDPDGNITQAEVTFTLNERYIISQSVVSLNAIQYPPDGAPESSTKTPGSSTTKKTATPDAPAADDTQVTPPLTDSRGELPPGYND